MRWTLRGDAVVIGMPPRAVDAVRIKVERAPSAGADRRMLPEGVTAYFELPDRCRPRAARGRTRARQGAHRRTHAGRLPCPAATGALSVSLRRRRACLSRRRRDCIIRCARVQRCTYEADSPTALMHGFVNVFLAAALLWHGGSEAATRLRRWKSNRRARFTSTMRAWRGTAIVSPWSNSVRRASSSPSASALALSRSRSRDLQRLGWL